METAMTVFCVLIVTFPIYGLIIYEFVEERKKP